MTDTPMKIVVNCETGVTEEIPLTAEEIAQREADAAAYAAAQAERESAEAEAAAKKAAVLAALAEAAGLSVDEVSAALGA